MENLLESKLDVLIAHADTYDISKNTDSLNNLREVYTGVFRDITWN